MGLGSLCNNDEIGTDRWPFQVPALMQSEYLEIPYACRIEQHFLRVEDPRLMIALESRYDPVLGHEIGSIVDQNLPCLIVSFLSEALSPALLNKPFPC